MSPHGGTDSAAGFAFLKLDSKCAELEVAGHLQQPCCGSLSYHNATHVYKDYIQIYDTYII